MPFTAVRARGRSEVISGEGTVTCKTETLGENYLMACERLAVQGWSSGETGVSTDGGAATRSTQATVGRLRPAVQGLSRPRPPLLEPAELQKATEEDRSHSSWPVQPELQGIVTGNSKKSCPRQVAGAQMPREVPRAASRGHRLHSRGSTAQWRRCKGTLVWGRGMTRVRTRMQFLKQDGLNQERSWQQEQGRGAGRSIGTEMQNAIQT